MRHTFPPIEAGVNPVLKIGRRRDRRLFLLFAEHFSKLSEKQIKSFQT